MVEQILFFKSSSQLGSMGHSVVHQTVLQFKSQLGYIAFMEIDLRSVSPADLPLSC